MRLWLIKLGKAMTALKNEGLLRGGRRILLSFFALFRRVGSGDILFVTGGLGDSARYRCHHVAEELCLKGFKTSVTVQDNPFLSRYANKFSVVIFHRVLWTGFVESLVKKLKEQQKTIIFDTDDLVFDPEYFQHMDYFRVMNSFEKKQYEGGVGAEILTDPYVEVATVSTSFLAEKLRERGKKVFLVPNRLSEEDVKIAEKSHEVRSTKYESTSDESNIQNSEIVVGYFSGSKGHDKDFATVSGVLLELLKKYDHLKLFIGGPLKIGGVFDEFGDRIVRLPYVPRAENFRNMSKMDIIIAPLEIGNPFCESKSELKFFEAGIVSVPVVAAATQTFREAITDGVDGFVALNETEWHEKLEQLIFDVNLRETIGMKARETALKKYTTKHAENREYYEYLKACVGSENNL